MAAREDGGLWDVDALSADTWEGARLRGGGGGRLFGCAGFSGIGIQYT